MDLRQKAWAFMNYTNGYTDTVSGVSPLSLPKAKANSLSSLKAFGGCEQTGTPSPTNVCPIVCNNGVLKVSPNLFNSATVTEGEFVGLYGEIISNDIYGHSDYIPIVNGKSYIKSNITAKTIAFYNTSKTFVERTNVTSFTATYDGYVIINYTLTDTNMQFEEGSTATSYMPYGQIYTDGTVETIEDTIGNTATTEMLLKVGDYQDVQSIIDGGVTRNVGIKVLDGTENIGKSVTYGGSFFVRNVVSDWGTSNNAQVFCSHFDGVTAESSYAQNKCMILNNAFNMWWAGDNTPTLAQFTQWLADKYNAGTPVTIVYPLATATTESVTGQTLQVQAGNNILEITQASLNNLTLEAKYRRNK